MAKTLTRTDRDALDVLTDGPARASIDGNGPGRIDMAAASRLSRAGRIERFKSADGLYVLYRLKAGA